MSPLPALRRLGLGFGAVVSLAGSLWAQGNPAVSGRVTVLDKDNKVAEDVGRAVIWLETAQPVPTPPGRADMSTENKQFLPGVVVMTVGSTLTFPNHDPFNHNVFSLSDVGPFDLGLYGRGEGKTVTFQKAGIVRVYCNVHAQMSGFVLVRDNPYFAQPSADGSFTIPDVPPGEYIVHAWHERGKEYSRDLRVPPSGLDDLQLTVDARGYKYKAHLNKYGQPYSDSGRRY
ncbi:MAG TPA: hypothetical protein VLT17_01620 [Gemmatimonadales bacterium]|jgi:plastocyanin|nr:hypothetical protein [Gemmatimonadales bacterium]